MIQIQNMPLWHNSVLNIDYRKVWENKGYHILNDVLDNKGNLFTMEKMIENKIDIDYIFRLKNYETNMKRILKYPDHTCPE